MKSRNVRLASALLVVLCSLGIASPAAASVPTFGKVFAPDMIGPGSTSRLTFTITNPDGTGVTMLAFDDEFPAGMTLAAPGFVSNSCNGTVTLDDDDSDSEFDVRLTDGVLGPMASCKIVVNVTAGATGGMETTYMNVSGDLTSSAGNSGTAADDLVVKIDRPGFTKVFSPTPVAFGGRSTLKFTIDNSLNASAVPDLDFTDNLPPGMVVASPSNKATTCVSPSGLFTTVVKAVPGSNQIILDANGSAGFPVVAAGGSCTVSVDVIGGAVGKLGNVSGELFSAFFGVSSGRAANVLEVTGIADLLSLEKEFIADPVPPGGTVNLKFTLTNRSRDDSATGLAFTDDLAAVLPGTPDLTATGVASNTCAGSTVDITTDPTFIDFSGGTLGKEASCTVSVTILVPAGATPGTYPNSTGAITGDVGGSPESGDPGSDLLFVVAFPALTKEWTDDPVGAGDTVTLKFTIQNTDTSAAMSDIAFQDPLTSTLGDEGGTAEGQGFLPFPVSVTLPGGSPCGGSVSLVSCGTDCQAISLSGGSLDANDSSPGGTDECSFTVDVDIPAGFPSGSYLNKTEEITATVGSATVTGPQASDIVVIEGTPTLEKEFTDDPVAPGGTVTLLFTLSHDEAASGDATSIAFTDDLAAAVPGGGLTATAVGPNSCTGSTVDITTDPTKIAFSGGSLMPGTECSFSVTISVPGGAPSGIFLNATSGVTATVGGVTATGNPAEDDLVITGLLFSKEFLGDPVVAGAPVTLKFTLDNTSGTADATGIVFTDDLSAVIPPSPGLTATGPPTPPMPCGFTDASSPTFLAYFGGAVLAGTSCSFTVPLLVPATIDPDGGGPIMPFPTPDDAYANSTSSLGATIGGGPVSLPPAVDELIVQTTNLALDKEFTDDPAVPGGTVTLLFTLENVHPTGAASAIAFTDDLGAALAGLKITSELTNTCGGTVSGVDTSMFGYTGGSLAASDGMPGGPDTCAIELLLTLPPGPLAGDSFPNTTSGVTGTIGGFAVTGDPASDTLEVDLVTFTKSFDGPTVAGGTAVLTFTLTNLDSSGGVTPLAFADNLDAVISGLVATVLPPAGACGAGSTLSGTSFLSLNAASLAAAGSPGDSCSFDVTVTVPATATGGDFLNATSALFQSGLPVASPATAFLIIEPPPLFSKAFAPDSILIGGVSTLTFTIDNSASGTAATSLDFTDALPAGVEVAPTPAAATDCTGGTITAMAGSGVISYTGGEVAAGAVCTVEVDVVGTAGGVLVNTSGDLTSSSGNSGPATDTLTVTVPDADLSLVKTDLSDPAMAGSSLSYKLTVTNLGPDTAAGVTLVDGLPAGTLFLQASTGCTHSAGVVTCSLGTIAFGASKIVSIQVLVLPDAVSPIENMATVSSIGTDPVAGNNDAMISTGVEPFERFVVLDDVGGNGFDDVAYPIIGPDITYQIRDIGTKQKLFQAPRLMFPAGRTLVAFDRVPDLDGDGIPEIVAAARNDTTGNHVVRVLEAENGQVIAAFGLPPGLLITELEVIDDNGAGDPLLAIGTHQFSNGVNRIRLRRASDGANLGLATHNPAFFPIDIADVPTFIGDPGPELAVVGTRASNGVKRAFVRELSGALATSEVLPASLEPIGMQTVPDFAGAPAPELAILGFDRALDKPRVITIDADLGTTVVDISSFPVGAFPAPKGLEVMPDFGGTPAPELAVLYRTPAGTTAVRVRDAGDSSQLFVGGFGSAMGAVPLGIDVVPDFAGTPAPELAVYTKDVLTGDRFITVRDASSAAVLKSIKLP